MCIECYQGIYEGSDNKFINYTDYGDISSLIEKEFVKEDIML